MKIKTEMFFSECTVKILVTVQPDKYTRQTFEFWHNPKSHNLRLYQFQELQAKKNDPPFRVVANWTCRETEKLKNTIRKKDIPKDLSIKEAAINCFIDKLQFAPFSWEAFPKPYKKEKAKSKNVKLKNEKPKKRKK